MKTRSLLNYLAGAVETLEEPTTKTIVLPNELAPEDSIDADVFFEIFSGGTTPEIETENSDVGAIVGSIVLNGRTNVGVAYLDGIAENLLALFRANNPNRRKGFVDGNAKAYVVGVERSEGGIDNGRYKITIFITFDIYED